MDSHVTFTLQHNLESITEQIRQFVSKKYPLESTDDGISIPIKGHLNYDFINETLVLCIEPN